MHLSIQSPVFQGSDITLETSAWLAVPCSREPGVITEIVRNDAGVGS